MRGERLRLVWSAAVAVLASWFFGSGELDWVSLPVFLLVVLVAYRMWPAFGDRLPPDYALRVTGGGIAVGILGGLLYAAAPRGSGSGSASFDVLAERFMVMVLGTFSIGVVASVLGARVFEQQRAGR